MKTAMFVSYGRLEGETAQSSLLLEVLHSLAYLDVESGLLVGEGLREAAAALPAVVRCGEGCRERVH